MEVQSMVSEAEEEHRDELNCCGSEPQRHDQQWHGKDSNGKGYEWSRIAAARE